MYNVLAASAGGWGRRRKRKAEEEEEALAKKCGCWLVCGLGPLSHFMLALAKAVSGFVAVLLQNGLIIFHTNFSRTVQYSSDSEYQQISYSCFVNLVE